MPRSVPVVVRSFLLVAGLALSGSALHAATAEAPATAAVARVAGYRATVLGWTSWYGSYGMGALGTAWCIDHGSAAPDPAFAYAPTPLGEVPAAARQAMAWAVGRYGPTAGRVDSAALMLVLHDLMGARYPAGRLDVDRLGSAHLAGFGADEGAVLARARAIKADALARSHLRWPLRVEVAVGTATVGTRVDAVVRLVDAAGAPVPGMVVAVHAEGGRLGAARVTTGADGRARVGFVPATTSATVGATALVPDLGLQAFAPTARHAQRVARPATAPLSARTTVRAAPPTGALSITKVDDATGNPVAGAHLAVRRADGTPIAELTSAASPNIVRDLAPGPYDVVEVAAPPGYARAEEPHRTAVVAGRTTDVVVRNVPTATITFRKVPGQGPHPPDPDLSGAVLVVADGEGAEVGRCGTAPDGTCALPAGSLRGATRYCWYEQGAPPGWGLAEGGCVTTGAAGSSLEVVVVEPPLFVDVRGRKVDASTGAPLAGARYELRADVSNDGDPPLAVAESGADGALDFGPQLPGARYCAHEVEPPAGYQRARAPTCTDVLAPGAPPAVLDLRDEPIPPHTTSPSPATTTPAGSPPRTAPPAPPAITVLPTAAELPRTGQTHPPLVAIGGGLVLVGAALAVPGSDRGARVDAGPEAAEVRGELGGGG